MSVYTEPIVPVGLTRACDEGRHEDCCGITDTPAICRCSCHSRNVQIMDFAWLLQTGERPKPVCVSLDFWVQWRRAERKGAPNAVVPKLAFIWTTGRPYPNAGAA